MAVASETLIEMKSNASRVVPRTAPSTRLFAVDSGMKTTSSWLRPAAPSPFLSSTPITVKGTLPIRNVSPIPARPSKSSSTITEPTMATLAPDAISSPVKDRPLAICHSRATR